MGKRKGRCARRNKAVTDTEPDYLTKAPHSFVIQRGVIGKYLYSLMKDFRKIMEPFTACQLRAKKKNSIKDFVSISGLLHVSHLITFTITEQSPYLKIARLQQGPTVTFKIHDYVLARDIQSSLHKPLSQANIFKNAPLIILNGFTATEEIQLKLVSSMFQSMFPTINITKVNLNTIRRCVLVSYNAETKLMEFRHYSIHVRPVGIARSVKKIVYGKIPNLSKYEDISEYIENNDILSESEGEDDPNSHVTLPQRIAPTRGNLKNNKSAIRLSEVGPRITLQLIKVEEGLMGGEVIYHEFVHKTEEEKEQLKKNIVKKRKLKEKRRKEQEDNVKQKEIEKEKLKQKSLEGMRKKEMETNSTVCNEEENDDDVEWYKKEIGEEPDTELFSVMKGKGMKRSFNTTEKRFKKYRKITKNSDDCFQNKDRRHKSTVKTNFNSFKGRNGKLGTKVISGKRKR